MSLIYQALEKAQSEKQKDAAPADAAIHAPLSGGERAKRRLAAPLILSAAGVAACAAYFFFFSGTGKTPVRQTPAQHPPGSSGPIVPPDRMPFPDVVPPPAPDRSAVIAPVAASSPADRAPAAMAEPAVQAPVAPAVQEAPPAPQPVPVAEPKIVSVIPPQRPADYDVELPGDITLSGIISDERSSLAVINGKILSEGETVRENIRVKKINKDNVVIEMSGKEFTLSR
ncbi:MAG TPA: general secretion pathway protein GspB [bacterium]|nr:general secretion pathway protein GspB [bacterium]